MNKPFDLESISSIGLVGASCRAMAASLRNGPYQVFAADCFADFDTRQLAITTQLRKYPWSALDWLCKTKPDAWCYTGGFENYPRLLEKMVEASPLLGNASHIVGKIRNPFTLAQLAEENHFRFPEIALSSQSVPPGRWLKKPFRSAGGLSITSTESPGQPDRRYYQQRFVDGIPMSVAVLSNLAKWQVIGASRLLVGRSYGAPTDFMFAGALNTTLSKLACREELERIVDCLHRQHNLIGLWGVDFMLHADECTLLEVNPRWTATMPLYERTLGVDLMPVHLSACASQSPPTISRETSSKSGMRILYAKQDFVADQLFLNRLMEFNLGLVQEEVRHSSVADLPNPGTPILCGHPICTVYADGETTEEVEATLAHQATHINQLVSLNDPN